MILRKYSRTCLPTSYFEPSGSAYMVFYAHSRWQAQTIQRMGACSHGAGTSGASAQGRGVGAETLQCLCFLLMTLMLCLLILCVFICSLHHFYFSWLSFCPWTYEMLWFGCWSLWPSISFIICILIADEWTEVVAISCLVVSGAANNFSPSVWWFIFRWCGLCQRFTMNFSHFIYSDVCLFTFSSCVLL